MTKTINAITDNATSQTKPMTIQKAKELYKQFGPDIRLDMESVVNLIRGASVKDPLCNSNYLHALAYTELMIERTQSRFLMLTGCAGGGFLDCLKDAFTTMLRRLEKNQGKAKIILVNSESRGPLDELKAQFPKTLEFTEATAKSDIKHMIVGDDDMARDEEYHQKFTEVESAEVIKANVYFRNPSQAAALSRRFDAIWEHLSGSTT